MAALLAGAAFQVAAQDFPMHRGGPDRTGASGLSPSTGGATPPSTYNNIGRGFLRWWDPISSIRRRLDNDAPANVADPAGSWTTPVAGQELAFNYIQDNLLAAPYVYAKTVAAASAAQPTVSAGGTLATFAWNFTGLTPGVQYQLFANIPLGPTDDDPSSARNLLFPQRYYVYQVSGVEGGPQTFLIDTFAVGGGLAGIGEPEDGEARLFTADASGTVTLRLFNTTPRAQDGGFLDGGANPGSELVYADAAEIVSATGQSGAIVASPIVGEIGANRPTGGVEAYRFRVVSARNEQASAGALGRQYQLGLVTSFAHNGAFVDLANRDGRRNMVWSWPVRRPMDLTAAENQRYIVDKENWIVAHADQTIQTDNLNGSTSVSGSFVPGTTLAPSVGPNYLIAPIAASIAGTADSEVRYSPQLPTGQYRVQMWLPSGGANLASKAEVLVYSGAQLVDRASVNQAAFSGWVNLPGMPTAGYWNAEGAQLRVVVTNRRQDPTDAGKSVLADAIRFIRQADLGVTSTPVQVQTNITLPGGATASRDVVVVAMENGRLYCMDAHGDPITGDPPQVYWTYPTETAGVDPNHVDAEDGQGGIAEMPTGFDLSSALVANVGGRDMLYIGSKNGRVYAIEMSGRGDGSTRRAWTFPDDFDPSAPSAAMASSSLGAFVGSVAYAEPGGAPTLFVPTTQGRLYALDAAGSAASKSTTIRWQYPAATDPTLGPITMTPLLEGGRVFFGAPTDQVGATGTIFALDQASGAVLWQLGTHGGEAFGPFRTASPTFATGAELGTGLDSLFFATNRNPAVANSKPKLLSLDPATGAVRWFTDELPADPSASLVFTYGTAFNNLRLPIQGTPLVMVPATSGALTGYRANGDVNSRGSRRAWSYSLQGSPLVASPGLGGKNPAEIFSWMYAGDSDGFLYAFNHDPGLADNNQFITGGVPPGQEVGDDNDEVVQDLNEIMANAKIALISPSKFEELQDKLREGTLNYADLVAAATPPVTRTHFEFGEVLYVMIYDLPSSNGTVTSYDIQLQVNGPQRSTRARGLSPNEIPGTKPSGRELVMMTAYPLITGSGNGLVPGPNSLAFRAVTSAASGRRGVQSEPRTFEFTLANPLAIAPLGGTWLGNTLDPADASVVVNGNPTGVMPLGAFGPDLAHPADLVGHGQGAVGRLMVRDRSLSTLIYGPGRGLQNVVLGLGDLAWVKRASDPTGGVIKPLDPALYPEFEDYPLLVPNTSVDYPNIDEANIQASKDVYGRAENPLFAGVGLNPPAYTDAQVDTYRETAGYNLRLERTLQNTPFDLMLSVPRFQPPSLDGYRSQNSVRVAATQPQRRGTTDVEPYRLFALGVNVGIDERLSVATPTVDLGSMPSGGGFNGGPGGGPAFPWDAASGFKPWNPAYSTGPNAMFQPFEVHNDGNVNLLNVRVAKSVRDSDTGWRPSELFGPGVHELAWLEAAAHLYSDLDPALSATARSGLDAAGRNIVQKARAADLVSTRLSVNPERRANASLDVAASNLLDPAAYPPGDPKVGVSTPIGAPSGEYAQNIFVFEDNVPSAIPELRWDEPFADPSMVVRFKVRESRLTNRPTAKSAPMVEGVVGGGETFRWENQAPTGLRDGQGNVLMAWSSDRLNDSSVPGWDPRARTEADSAANAQWRVYISGLLRDPSLPVAGESPIGDLNQFVPSAADRWMTRASATPLPNVSPDTLFGGAVNAGSAKFGAPTFPSSGTYNMMDAPGAGGRPSYSARYLAMLGQATRGSQALSTIVLQPLQINADATVTPGTPSALPYDLTSGKSKPSLVQLGAGAVVFYASYASGPGRLNWNSYNWDGNGTWSETTPLDVGNGFESIGAPSVTLRRYRNTDVPRFEVGFTGKLRGRPFTEAFMGRLNLLAGLPSPVAPWAPFESRTDELDLDPASGVYWAPGVLWNMDDASAGLLDVRMLRGGTMGSVLKTGSGSFNRSSGIASFETTLGGQVYLDSSTGSVRFAGGLIPRGSRLFVTYSPKLLRMSSGPGSNYRAMQMVFDDRFLGVAGYANPRRNLLGDLSYWFGPSGAPSATAPIRWDRQLVGTTRTAGEGDSATRPYLQSMRLGIVLPTAVSTRADGTLKAVAVNITDGSVPASERFYQVDPISGRIFFMAGAEDALVNVSYKGVDEAGADISGFIGVQARVGWIAETSEAAMPIEQVGNESGLSLALDPLGPGFNETTIRRPGLIWAFWTSTRAGSRDVYFQTLAPRFSAKKPGE